MKRTAALITKEFIDQRRNPMLFLPVVIIAVRAIALPLFVAIIGPAVAGEKLSDSSDFEVAVEMYRNQPETRGLDPEGAIQAFVFQYFLLIFLLIPVTCAMSVAAYGIVGEKQARALEPLLATPITTMELLGAKVLGALLPSVMMSLACVAVYLLTVAALARPGVVWVMLGPRSLGIVFLLGPLAALAALQMSVCVSSRVNDARTAQQVGVTVILPIVGLFISQLAGAFQLTVPVILTIAAGLLVVNGGLMVLAVRLFDRETILTRWK